MRGKSLIPVLCCVICASLSAELKPEKLTVATLGMPSDHWVFLNDFSDKAYLYDADTGAMLGMLALGSGSSGLEISPDLKLVYAKETYYSRHTRATRTDVVTTYDLKNLSGIAEVEVPARTSSGMPHREYSGLLDSGQFMLVNNTSPALSVSVVDLNKGEFVEEIATAGCSLIYPNGDREFLQLCGDGTVQQINLDRTGREQKRERSAVFFDLATDPVSEQAARTDGGWLFITFSGVVHEVGTGGDQPQVVYSWALTDESTADWRPGGLQSVAYHRALDLLLVLMHAGGADSHKDPGTEVWVYKASDHRRIARIGLARIASSIAVSQDATPQLYTAFMGVGELDIYNLLSGNRDRTIKNAAAVPSIIQSLQAP